MAERFKRVGTSNPIRRRNRRSMSGAARCSGSSDWQGSALPPEPRSNPCSEALSAPSAARSVCRSRARTSSATNTVTGNYPVIADSSYAAGRDRDGAYPAPAQPGRSPVDEEDQARPSLPMRDRLVRAGCPVGRSTALRCARACRDASGCDGAAILLGRRRLHREPHASPGTLEGHPCRRQDAGRQRHLRARWSGSAPLARRCTATSRSSG